jgi:hypothetical protein
MGGMGGGGGFFHVPVSGDESCEDTVWDSVRFRNPLDFPMTTAPATIVSDGHFNGQRICGWANRGEEVTLHIKKALGIQTQSLDREADSDARHDKETVFGDRYVKFPAEGVLRAKNHRNEPVKLAIRCPFTGTLVSADRSPTHVLLARDSDSVNPSNALLWNIELKPGEEITLTYRYTKLKVE